MPQPPLRAPLAPRPEPGAQLLEAVQLRQSQRSLQLAQQWVHRRGVLDLQRFCSTELSSALGAEAVAWLQELLALEALPLPTRVSAAPVSDSTLQQDPSLSPVSPLPQADRMSSTAADATPAPPPEPTPSLDLMLHARAVAAVDEAFAALAQSFQEDSGSGSPAPDDAPKPLALAPLTSAPLEQAIAPQPQPVRSGLWPSLRASAAGLRSALQPASGGQNPGPAGGDSLDAIPAQAQPTPISGATAPQAAAAPDPLQADTASVAGALSPLALTQEGADATTPQPSEAEQEISPPAAPTAAEAAAEAAAPAGLLQRLRGRIPGRRLPRLSRLRTVMRDCAEETLALLRAPAPEPIDDDVFEVSQPQAALLPLPEQPGLSGSLDPFLPPSPKPTLASLTETAVLPPQIPAAAVAAAPAAAEPTASAPAPSPRAPGASDVSQTSPTAAVPTSAVPPAAVQTEAVQTEAVPNAAAATMAAPSSAARPAPRQHQSLAGSKPSRGGDRPAPAPATLSDLRAWLPNRGDLPRAS